MIISMIKITSLEESRDYTFVSAQISTKNLLNESYRAVPLC